MDVQASVNRVMERLQPVIKDLEDGRLDHLFAGDLPDASGRLLDLLLSRTACREEARCKEDSA